VNMIQFIIENTDDFKWFYNK